MSHGPQKTHWFACPKCLSTRSSPDAYDVCAECGAGMVVMNGRTQIGRHVRRDKEMLDREGELEDGSQS